MPRGFQWSVYVDDQGASWSLRVDADEAQDPIRGWTVVTDVTTPPLPRGWRPRYVQGLDENGNPRRARVGTVDCGLWLGSATTFTVEGTDQLLHQCEVIARQQENTRTRPT
jgi:hypothetical protein